MKCGFYDSKIRGMVVVEDWADSLQVARSTSLMMTSLYLSGRHRMPSAIWCVWDGAEVSSVFLLDNKMRSQEFLDQILPLLV